MRFETIVSPAHARSILALVEAKLGDDVVAYAFDAEVAPRRRFT